MTLYELVFIARQEISPIRAKELAKKINDFVKTKGGDIKKEEYWGFRSLSYEINKNKKGHCLFFIINLSSSYMLELSTQIKLTEDIIRHMIVKIKEKESYKEPSLMMEEEANDWKRKKIFENR